MLTVYFFLSGLTLSIVWVAIYSIWSTLLMFHTDIHTDAIPTLAPTLAHTHTDPFLACSQSPWRCLFTLHCDSCVCVCLCVCVDLGKEILCVKCSPGLNYNFWVLSHHPTSPGLNVFLSVSLSIIHTHTLSLSHTHAHIQEELQTVLAQWGVQSERREETGVTWPVGEHTHFFRLENQSCNGPIQTCSAARPLWPATTTQVQLSDHWSLWITNV